MYSKLINIRIPILTIATLVLTSLILVFVGNGTASASSGNVTKFDMKGGSSADGCFDDGALMNVVVHVELVNEKGNRIGWGNNYSVQVESWDPGNGTRDAGIVPPSGNNWVKDHTFNPAGESKNFESCDPPGGGTKAQSLTFEGSGTEPNAWKLSCGYGALGNQNRKFRFTGRNAPDNIPSDYKAVGWGAVNGTALISESSKNDINGFSYRIVLTYRVERVRTATLTPSPSSYHKINVGTSFTFQQRVTASNRQNVDDDTFNWSVTGESSTSGSAAIAGDNPRASSDYTVTYDTRGTRTRTIGVSSAPGYVTKGADATQTLEVIGWDIIPDSSVNKPTIIVGQSATFTHRLYSSGAPLHKDVDGDVVIAAGSSSMPQCSASGADSPGCWNYRFKDTDLTPTDSDQTASRTYTFTQVGTYCEQISYNPYVDDDTSPTLYDYSGYSLGTKACVDVIDPTPTASTGAEYEKGGPGVTTVVGVIFAGPCPTVGIIVKWYYSVPDLGINNIEQDAKYGGVYGCSNTTKPIPLDAYAGILNGLAPGTTYGTESYVPDTNERKFGQFSVIEVPFARFYGNDIYATNGEIRFNDTGDPNNAVQRGSVNQYAALSFGNVQIDTSSFRTLPIAAPNPPNGLDVANVGADLNRIKATSVYEDVKNNLPTNCTQIDSGGLNTPQNGCYVLNDGTVGWSNGIPFIGWGDTIGAGVTTYDKKVTITNPTNKMLMIAGDIVNLTSYTDPSNAGVLLIVSEGPIVIDNNVRRVDAILVSKSGIYTCGIAGFGPLLKKPQNGIHQTCREPLNINGAISAPTIDFRRAVGSRYLNASGGDEQQNCQISKGIQNCDTRGTNLPNNTGATAEIVNFPTYLYFAKPFLRDTTASGADTDAIFVAPPRL